MKLLKAFSAFVFFMLLMVSAQTVFGQTYGPMPYLPVQFSYNSGAPVALGWVCTLTAGGSAPLTTYQTSGGTAHTNPIHLDAGGRPPGTGIYMDTASAMFVLYAPGTGGLCGTTVVGALIKTIDNVTAASLTAGTTTGSGTANLGTKFTGSTVLGNSTYYDDGTSSSIGTLAATDDPTRIRFEVRKDQNEASAFLFRNDTPGGLSQAVITARSDTVAGSNDISMGVTSTTFTTLNGIPALSGRISTGVSATGGLYLHAGAGNVNIQPAGNATTVTFAPAGTTFVGTTTFHGLAYTWPASQSAGTVLTTDGTGGLSWTAGGGGGSITGSGTANLIPRWSSGTALTNSAIFDDGTSTTIGTNVASDDALRHRFQVQKDQNESTNLLVRNNTSGTLGRATVVARSGSASDDIAMGITSGTYTTAGGVPASAGFLYTGVNATAGLYVQSGAGNINVQPAGTAITAIFAPTGTTFVGTTTLNAITYTWPASQAAGTFLTTNGTGGLTWSTGLGTSGTVSGSGTVNLVPRWSSGTALTNSTLFDDGTTTTIGTLAVSDDTLRHRFEVEKDQNESTNILLRNNTSGTLGRAAFVARSGSASDDIAMGVTSAAYTTAAGLPANSGFLYTGVNATAGMVIQTGAGNIFLQPAGTTTKATFAAAGTTLVGTLTLNSIAYTFPASQSAGTFLTTDGAGALTWTSGAAGVTGSGTANLMPRWSSSTALTNSTFYDDGTSSSIGTNAATDDPTRHRFEVEKDQNESTGLIVRNNTSGGLARAAVIARSGSTNLDIAIGATSPSYTTAGGLAANTAFVVAGDGATNGMLLHTGAGAIEFQVGGNGTDCSISTAGLMTCTSFSGSGAALTAINAASNLSGVAPFANGGTGNSAFPANRIPYSAGTLFTSNGGLTFDGTTLAANQLTTATVNSSGVTISFNLPGSTYAVFTSNGLGAGSTSLRLAMDGNTGTNAVTLGAADSCGAGFRCMKMPN